MFFLVNSKYLPSLLALAVFPKHFRLEPHDNNMAVRLAHDAHSIRQPLPLSVQYDNSCCDHNFDQKIHLNFYIVVFTCGSMILDLSLPIGCGIGCHGIDHGFGGYM